MATKQRGDGPAFEPPHPGAYLREDILPELGMTITQLATHLGVTRPTLSNLVNEKSDLSLEMAVRLGQAFRNGTRFWMSLQMQRDIWNLEQNKGPQLRVAPLARSASAA